MGRNSGLLLCAAANSMEVKQMTTAYSGAEIVEIAIQIEGCGEAYYEEAISQSRSQKAKEIFTHLRDEEHRHAKIFEGMLPKMREADSSWRHNEEYSTYMHALAENRVFPTPEAARQAVKGLSDDISAVRYALGFEKDTILFFHEMRSAAQEKDFEVIDKLIAEERKHIQSLTGLLNDLKG